MGDVERMVAIAGNDGTRRIYSQFRRDETEEKLRVDTMVVALAGESYVWDLWSSLHFRWLRMGTGLDTLRSKQRATGRVLPLLPLLYSRPEARRREMGSET